MTPPAPVRWPPVFHLYRGLSRVLAPFLRRMAGKRHARMGGSADRLPERFGIAGLPRPDGGLVWVNAASLGELRAAQPIIERMQGVSVLVTTSTQSAADLAARHLPDQVLHQFAPMDTPREMAGFLSHWRPDLAVFMESDLPLWAISALEGRTPMANLNARPSRTRQRFPRLSAAILSRMALVTAQDQPTADELRGIGATNEQIAAVVDLKSVASPPKPDVVRVAELQAQIGKRPVWLAMSIHPEELPTITQAHRQLLEDHPDLLLVLAPRHPDKAEAFHIGLSGFSVASRSKGEQIGAAQVYLADTLGETGTLFAVAPFAVIGGTFARIGGHSPQEALKTGLPVIFGPFPGAHQSVFQAADALGAARQAADAAALANRVERWLGGAARTPAEAAARDMSSRGADIPPHIAKRLLALIGRPNDLAN
ncbi:3-deoxy-D-manno-octulosonic acid transferase [Shimia biformata]|uniref:3-deoxy-D-manno-octulosonic acid transferase n=1 Tax=Shimia biformata TaxID=1294299 RepID=UPI001951E1F0|nr:glycosyltransferase N-terminal domain-containing protein [Shimia biformata]